jgi:GTP-sensing pleiotropic transcriptional regulator CodY
MEKHTYEITLNTATEVEAEIKMKALVVLAQSLSAKELNKLSHIVKHDPIKTALAKKYLGV